MKTLPLFGLFAVACSTPVTDLTIGQSGSSSSDLDLFDPGELDEPGDHDDVVDVEDTVLLGDEPLLEPVYGRTWKFGLTDGLVHPPVGGDMVGGYKEDLRHLFVAIDQDEHGATALLGTGSYLPTECHSTVELELDWQDPTFESIPVDALVDVDEVVIQLYDIELGGVIAPDGKVAQATLTALVDTRSLVYAFEYTEDDEVCQLGTAAALGCVPCPDGANLCWEVAFDLAGAETYQVVSAIEEPTCDSGSWTCAVAPVVPGSFAIFLALATLRRRR